MISEWPHEQRLGIATVGGGRLFTIDSEKTLRVWDVDEAHHFPPRRPQQITPPTTRLNLTPNADHHAVCASEDGKTHEPEPPPPRSESRLSSPDGASGRGRAPTYKLYSNGKINSPDAEATWVIKTESLLLKWPYRAPGGHGQTRVRCRTTRSPTRAVTQRGFSDRREEARVG